MQGDYKSKGHRVLIGAIVMGHFACDTVWAQALGKVGGGQSKAFHRGKR